MTNTIWPVITAAAVALIGAAAGLLCWWHDRVDSSAFDRGYEEGKRVGRQQGAAEGRVFGATEERARQAKAEEEKRRAEEKKRSSPWARDIPCTETHKIEVASVPYGAVTLRASLVLDEHDLTGPDALTKDYVLKRLHAEILREAGRYIEVRQDFDPCYVGTRFLGVLRVLERR